MTHTYALLHVPQAVYDEIAGLMRGAGYDHVFGPEGEIDMHGIALTPEPSSERMDDPSSPMERTMPRGLQR